MLRYSSEELKALPTEKRTAHYRELTGQWPDGRWTPDSTLRRIQSYYYAMDEKQKIADEAERKKSEYTQTCAANAKRYARLAEVDYSNMTRDEKTLNYLFNWAVDKKRNWLKAREHLAACLLDDDCVPYHVMSDEPHSVMIAAAEVYWADSIIDWKEFGMPLEEMRDHILKTITRHHGGLSSAPLRNLMKQIELEVMIKVYDLIK